LQNDSFFWFLHVQQIVLLIGAKVVVSGQKYHTLKEDAKVRVGVIIPWHFVNPLKPGWGIT